jgi:hypothetical protein
MPFELVIIFSSIILYSFKLHRLNEYNKKFENYKLEKIIIKK